MMMKTLIILSVVVCAALADNYACHPVGDPFECFESAKDARFCITNGSKSEVICGKCKKKYEFCKNHMKVSRRADHDCGAGWESTPCTNANSHVPATY